MKAKVEIEAGVCGFKTRATAACEDGQNISSVEVASDCEKVQILAHDILKLLPLDAYQEISSARESRLLACCRDALKGCCSACAVPVGLFKAMQVAAELALSQDIAIKIKKEE